MESVSEVEADVEGSAVPRLSNRNHHLFYSSLKPEETISVGNIRAVGFDHI